MTMFLRNFNPSVFNYYALKAKHRISQSRWPHDLTGTIPSFHCSIPEALNGGMVWGGSVPAVATFCLFCRERLVTNSAISQSRWPHASQPFHDFMGTISSFHCSNHEAINGRTASGVIPATSIFGNGQ